MSTNNIQKALFWSRLQSWNQRQLWNLLVRGGSIGFLLVFGLTAQVSIVYGQIPGLTSSNESQVPQGVERFGFNEIIYLDFNGKKLFKISSPLVLNRSNSGTQIPVELRAAQIKSNLNQLIATTSSDEPRVYSTLIDPKTLQIKVEVIHGQPVLLVKDAHLVEPRVILTVTDSDAQYYGTSKELLAQRWQTLLKVELHNALESRQPEAFKQQTGIAVLYLGGTVLSTLIVAISWWLLGKRKQTLEEQQKEQEATLPTTELATSAIKLPEYLQPIFSLKSRLQLVRFVRWFLFWAFLLLWTAGLAAALYQFPQTRQFAVTLISTPALILISLLVTGLADSLSTIAIDQFIKASASSEIISIETLQRKSQRILTIAGAVQGLKTVLIYIVGVIFVLQTLQIAPVSILTLGAVLALAASFAAQSLVKDLTNGLLILLEDQYAVGDYVSINSVAGLVENLNLRITQLRSNSGNLITIPNSLVQQVENMGKNWSRATVLIDVAYETDIDAALKIVHATIDQLSQDPEWQPLILNPNELVGIEQISHSGMTIQVWIRTLPLKQWNVGRELRRRLKIALDSNRIQIGTPQLISIQQPTATSLPFDDGKQSK